MLTRSKLKVGTFHSNPMLLRLERKSQIVTSSLSRDAIITCIVNTLTCLLAGVLVFSILGYMAFVTGQTIHEVVNSGPGLVFLTYPDLVLSLPGSVVWATIFFVMLLVLGIDSEFCNVEALVTGIVDNWPDQLLKHRRKFTIALCFGLFCLGLPLCTNVSTFLTQKGLSSVHL